MKPTRKFYAATSAAVAAVVASWIGTGAFDAVERGMVATAIVSLTALYWQRDA